MRIAVLAACIASMGCARVPPLAPGASGSVGMTHRGILVGGVEMPKEGDGFRFLRDNDRRWALPRFADAIARAAKVVNDKKPGGVLTIGDVSAPHGGQIMPHFSHRSGRDADLLLYVTTLEGAPMPSPGFVHVQSDGLAFDEKSSRYYRFDVEREWILVKSLLEDDRARIQWMFVSDVVKAMLLDWAKAKGESTETLYRAVTAMAQPHPGGIHDDHVHVRTACNYEEIGAGCEPFGPERSWITITPTATATAIDDQELLQSILRPIGADERISAR